METVLRKVKCSDRLPINKGVYIGGSYSYHNEKIYWHGYWDELWQEDYGNVEYWYEEVSLMDISVDAVVNSFTEEEKQAYRNITERMVQEEAKERYEKALDCVDINSSILTTAFKGIVEKALKMAAGLKENEV